MLDKGISWFDTGTHESLLKASLFVRDTEQAQKHKIACLEDIAYVKGWIDSIQVSELAKPMLKNQYGQYLLGLVQSNLNISYSA